MKSAAPLPPLLSLTLSRPVAQIQSWRVGQLLRATVLTPTKDNHTQLRIGTQTVQARISISVEAGQHLELQVASLDPQPVLRLLTPQTADPVADATRQALPRQLPVGPLLANLQELAQAEQSSLPPEVLHNIQQLLIHLPRPSRVLTANQLRAAVLSSGVFLEARLGMDSPESTGLAIDLKANLLRLLTVLRNWPGLNTQAAPNSRAPSIPDTARALAPSERPAAASPANETPPPPMKNTDPAPHPPATPTLTLRDSPGAVRSTLQRQAEGVLARLQLNQLVSIPHHDSQSVAWHMELPIQGASGKFDVWSLRISREKPGGRRPATAGKPIWSIILAFDLPELGPVQAQVSVGSGNVSTVFWTDRSATHALFERHLGELRERFKNAGLTIDHLACRQGIPAPAPTAGRHGLLDENV